MHGEFSRFQLILDERDKLEGKRYILRVRDRVSKLTPAGKRLLGLMLNAYNVNAGMSLNRKQIADLLGRPSGGLTPHDRKLLAQLETMGILKARRAVLWTGDRTPCGAEFRYSMPEDEAWALNIIRRHVQRQRHAQRRKAG